MAGKIESGLKRKREANFDQREKYLLVNLVEIHLDIIENKRTDGSSSKQKMEAWEAISNNFNCESQTHVYRSSTSLKTQWKNLKDKAKILDTIDRRNISETGGGPPVRGNPNINDVERPLLERVSALLGQTINGVPNIYDSDGVVDQPQSQYEEPEEDNSKDQSEVLLSGDWSEYSVNQLRTPRTTLLRTLPHAPLIVDKDGQTEIDLSETIGEETSISMDGKIIQSTPKSFATFSGSSTVIPVTGPICSINEGKNISRRRPLVSKTKNDELVNAKLTTISLANEQASEIHTIMVQTQKEKLKQECLKTAILEEQLVLIRHKRRETVGEEEEA